MEQFYVGRTFYKPAPIDAIEWCNQHSAHIEKVNGLRMIVENPETPAPTLEETVKCYEAAVQDHLDKTARSRGYDNTYTCLSYLSSTNDTWRIESNAFNVWRDQVWGKCHEVMDAVKAGSIAVPTVNELISALPGIDWCDPVS